MPRKSKDAIKLEKQIVKLEKKNTNLQTSLEDSEVNNVNLHEAVKVRDMANHKLNDINNKSETTIKNLYEELKGKVMVDEGAKTLKPAQENWDYRNDFMRCMTCIHSAVKLKNVGRCKRNAPTMDGYPVIFLNTDSCGQHKLDETKV